MQLSEIVDKQVAADRKRGLLVDLKTDRSRYEQLTKDLVGLIGEIGEFANIVKKVGLKIEHPTYDGPSLHEASPQLQEELADTLIYVLRLSAILGSSLENDVLRKMAVNDARYSHLASNST